MNTTQTTDRNPLDLLTTGERETVLRMVERLPRAEREELTATGMLVAFMVGAAKHLIAWRGRE